MRKLRTILLTGCFLAMSAGSLTVYADAQKSAHQVTLVASQADYANIAVSQVTDYVNIRQEANTSSEIVGKIYNNCAATILETVEGEGGAWYRIQSGTVNGYIKAQYFITGAEAEKLAQSIGREFVTINTESLRLREEPNLTSRTLTLLSQGARYVVQGEDGEFFKVQVDADLEGYIAQSYCKVEVEFDQAVSLAEEQAMKAEEAQRKQDAADAIAALEAVKQQAGSSQGVNTAELIIEANPLTGTENTATVNPPAISQKPAEDEKNLATIQGGGNSSQSSGDASGGQVVSGNPAGTGSGSGSGSSSSKDSSGRNSGNTVVAGSGGPGSTAVVSATRTAIVAYAKQFLGNPYVYGGTSLTDGADCSGFVQAIFQNFGITTGRSSRDQADRVREIPMSEIQPGDLLFYASGDYINHVAIYIGDGKVIHASNPTTGITISPSNYRTPCKAGTFLD
ncbi:MAG TPA: C40 family peptidase [Candidatus Ventrimonas merdavium]|nr:C40 family peptidase [Candidatus Ventrimonas merdavium]